MSAARRTHLLAKVRHGIRSGNVLIGYFDESENHEGSRLFALGGYVAADDDWPLVEREGRALLEAERLTRFHMKDFAHLKGEFTGWSEDRRRKLIGSFADILKRLVLASVVAAVELEPFERLVLPVLPPGHAYRNPYLVCLQACMERVNHWMARPPVPNEERWFKFVCEQRPKTAAAAEKHFRRIAAQEPWGNRFVGIEFAPKDDHVALQMADLQMADLVVYEARRSTANMLAGFPAPDRKSLTLLRAACLSECTYMDEEACHTLLTKLGLTAPSG